MTSAVLATVYLHAVRTLTAGAFRNEECCGTGVDELGRCTHRPGHATRAHPAPLDYPEHYDNEGNFRA